MDRLEKDMPDLLARFEAEKAKAPEDDYWSQMIYLMTRGVATMREGFATMDTFVATGDTDTLKAAVARMQEGNDSLGLAREMASARSRPGAG